MAVSLKPPKNMFARTGANPTLRTIEHVTAALKTADGPISRNRLMEILRRWGHSTTRRSLNASIEYLGSAGCVVEGSKGIGWVPPASRKLLAAIRAGRDL